MNRNNNIDDVFKSGMANYSETPPAYVWGAIEGKLQGVRSHRKVVVFWRSVAAAAVIGFIFLGGLIWHNLSDREHLAQLKTVENPVAKHPVSESLVSETEPPGTEGQSPFVTEENNVIDHADVRAKAIYARARNTLTAYNSSNNNAGYLKKLAPHAVTSVGDYGNVDATNVFHEKNAEAVSKVYNRMLFAHRATGHNHIDDKERKVLRFALGGQFSPSYSYRETGNGNSAVNEEGIMSYTGGINLSIKTRKKWVVETGVYYAQVGQKFSNPLAVNKSSDYFYGQAPNQAGVKSTGPNLSNSMGNIKLSPSSEQKLYEDAAVANSFLKLNESGDSYGWEDLSDISIRQELNYIEVPLLLRYNLIDEKFGLSVSGGMSTNFLIGNNAYQSDKKIGEIEGINSVSYSAIVGFGVRTPIFKSLDFNFEPKLKYFMNSVSNADGSDYKPYSIGVFTGISYTF